MIIERQNNEILIRIPMGMRTSRIQSIIDYLRYEELTSKSIAEQENVDNLVAEIKKGRWNKTKKRLGLDD